VKEIIIQTAREDNNTGVIPVNGSIQWGWGKVDAYNAVKLALSTVGTQEIDAELSWSVYPNPVLNELHFTLVDELPSKVEIVDAIGRVTIKNVQGSKVSVSDLKPGTYWVRLEMKGHIEQQAFIKQ